jgi:malonate transporter MadL subunit
MYIPIVVAMAAKQNVVAAVSGGGMAIIAGVLAVAVSFSMVPVLAKLSDKRKLALDPGDNATPARARESQ